MKRALGAEGQAALRECARRDALLAFDFDGTLAPIVPRPEEAKLRPETHRLLVQLARERSCLVLSGREPPDLAGRLRGIALVGCVGNHGASFGLGAAARKAAIARASRWRLQLDEQLGGRSDIELTDQGISLAVHFRRASNPAATRRTIRRAVAALPRACALDGKFVVNVLPADFAHKGSVLRTIARNKGAATVLFVGDDVTDEAAFRMAVAPCFVTIRVGRDSNSAARYYLSSQSEIDELLRTLLTPSRGPSDAQRPTRRRKSS